MKLLSRSAIVAMAGSMFFSASIARHDMEGGSHPAPLAPALAAKNALPYRGQVRSVDLAKGKVTLKHRPIVELGMTAIAMEYLAADKALLEGLTPGTKVKFNAERLHGAFVLTGIARNE